VNRGAIWIAAGLVTAILGLGGLVTVSRAAPVERSDWRPACVSALPDLQDADVRVSPAAGQRDVLILGLDVSRSNREALTAQLAAAQLLIKQAPLALDVGVLLVAEYSDASAVADLWLPGSPPEQIEADDPCPGECQTRSLFEQRCVDQLRDALDARLDQETTVIQTNLAAARAERTRELDGWAAGVATSEPSGGTSLVRFWRKVADLPGVRATDSQVTIMLLSDLVETEKHHRRWMQRVDSGEPCTGGSPLPPLDDARVVLLQTIGENDGERWGRRWERALDCAGARVERFRWTSALPLSAYAEGIIAP
jgi:hypothetical protein